MHGLVPRNRPSFQDTLPERFQAEHEAHLRPKSISAAIDEHRVGLQPILRRVWAPCGAQPVSVVHPHCERVWVVCFVHPESERTSWGLVPGLSIRIFQALLIAFVEEQGLGRYERIRLVLDQAGWHMSAQLELPEALTLDPLPPYSPELQPTERVCTLSDDVLARDVFESLQALEDVFRERCCELAQLPQLIRGHTLFSLVTTEQHRSMDESNGFRITG